MPAYTKSREVNPPRGSDTYEGSDLTLLGLDVSSPFDEVKKGRTSNAKNFRLHALDSDSRQVAVSSRKGSEKFFNVFEEYVENPGDFGDGTGDNVNVGQIENVRGVRFKPQNNHRLTRIELLASDPYHSSGVLLVELWTDENGKPSKEIAVSSILGSDLTEENQWVTADFISAPLLETTAHYWVILRLQDDAKGEYSIATSDIELPLEPVEPIEGEPILPLNSYLTNTTLEALEIQPYSLKMIFYSTPENKIKGLARYLRDNGKNTTVFAIDDAIYYMDDETKETTLITDRLSTTAKFYNFVHLDNKLFWVNGYNSLRYWDGNLVNSNPELITNGNFETANLTDFDSHTFDGVTKQFLRVEGVGIDDSYACYCPIPTSSCVPQLYIKKTFVPNTEYKLTAWIKAGDGFTRKNRWRARASAITAFNPNGGFPTTKSIGSINATRGVFYHPNGWTKFETTFKADEDYKGIALYGEEGTTFLIDNVSIKESPSKRVQDANLPIASDLLVHKTRLFVKNANDPNSLHFCQSVGNPTARTDPETGAQIPTTPEEQWYNSWRSLDVVNVPVTHAGSPVTAVFSFQDDLTVFTQDGKYLISGNDTSTFSMRDATGFLGAISKDACDADENHIYFVSKDGFYRYGGAKDEKISTPITPLFDACPNKEGIRVVVWKNQVRFYMASAGSSVNDMCLIYDKNLEEWLYDTGTFVDYGLWLKDTNDSQDLVEASSVVPQLYLADKDYHSAGAPIDFVYRLNYNSMRKPGQKKRIKRIVPVIQGVDTTFPITLTMNKDFQSEPRVKEVLMLVKGAKIGHFYLGDGTVLGGGKSFNAKRQAYSGYANYWQFGFSRRAVNNRVAIVGVQYIYKLKRL